MPQPTGRPLLLLVLCSSVIAVASDGSPPSAEELAGTTLRGKRLAQYDQAAWQSSDAVMAMEPERGSVERYLAQETPTGWVVVFGRLSERHDKFLIAFESSRSGGAGSFVAKRIDPPREDSGFYLHGARAIAAALADFQGADRPYNVMVLPQVDGRFFVYVVPAQTKPDVYPLGGDVRYLVSADGATILERRQLHKTILEMKSPARTGQRASAGVHSHVLSDVVEDTDVFYVLSRKPALPEYIGAGDHTYEVQTDGSITTVKR